MPSQLGQLIDQLEAAPKRALEKSASTCHAKRQYFVDWDHWLHELMGFTTPTVQDYFRREKFSVDICLRDLEASMNSQDRGNSGSPALSKWLISWMQQARKEAKDEFKVDSVSSDTLFYSLLTHDQLHSLAIQSSEEFKKLDPVRLRVHLKRKHLVEKSLDEQGLNGSTHSRDSDVSRGESAILQFTRDLTADARSGLLDPVIGRETETRQIVDILMRRRQNNPVIVGEAGVGKTALSEGLAQLIANGDVPPSLKDIRLLVLDMALLKAGAGVKGEFERRLTSLLEEIKTAVEPIVLFVDEMHTIVGQGDSASGESAANILKPALARGQLRTIGATTWQEYKRHIEKDPALARRFQVVKVDEPSVDEAIGILRRLAPKLELHHQVLISEQAISAAVQLSKRYLPDRRLPDKCISVLDTACSRAALSQAAKPAEISRIEMEMASEKQHLQHLEKGLDLGEHGQEARQKVLELARRKQALEQRWESDHDEMMGLVDQLKQMNELDPKDPSLKSKRDEFQEFVRRYDARWQAEGSAEPMVFPWVSRHLIAQVIEDWTQIPVRQLKQSDADDLLNLDKNLQRNVVGQDRAISAIAEQIKISRAGLISPEAPRGVFLLAGPSGVGKTETALCLAEEIYGSREHITFINMSEFKEEHKVSLLLGSPPGYVGFGEGGYLTEAVRRKPYSVILLDEIEKAHPGVYDIFYRIFDKGQVTDSEGLEVDFRNCVFIMTTNQGADLVVRKSAERDGGSLSGDEFRELTDHLKNELLKKFRPSFLGRTQIIPYMPLAADDMKKIVGMELSQINARIRETYKVDSSWSEEVVDWILAENNDPTAGGRHIKRIINHCLLPEVANLLLESLGSSEPARKGRSISIGLSDVESSSRILDIKLS